MNELKFNCLLGQYFPPSFSWLVELAFVCACFGVTLPPPLPPPCFLFCVVVVAAADVVQNTEYFIHPITGNYSVN